MQSPMLGTIIFAARRERFAILAADQLYHCPGLPTKKRSKIACHPSLPLAVAVAGFESLPIGGDPVASQVLEVISPIGDPDGLDVDNVIDMLRDRLHFPALEAHEQCTDELKDKSKCNLYIAAYTVGRTILAHLSLYSKIHAQTIQSFVIDGPGYILDAMKAQHSHDKDEYLGEKLDDSDALASRIRAVMQDAVDLDAKLKSDPDREIDGPIDMVIVNDKGVYNL